MYSTIQGLNELGSWVVGLPNNSYKSITNTAWVRARLWKLQKGWSRLTAASDRAYQLLVHERWFSLGTPASSTTRTSRHDIAECGVKHNKSNQQYNLIVVILQMDLDYKYYTVLFWKLSARVAL